MRGIRLFFILILITTPFCMAQVRYADQFPGTNAGDKIAASIADLPSTGGTVDARGLEGSQTISRDLFLGISKPVVLLLGAAYYRVTSVQTIQTSNQWIIGLGPAITFLRCDLDDSCIRVQNSPFQPLQMGGGLEGFRMDGCANGALHNCNLRPDSHGIHLGDAVGFVIRDLYVRDFQGTNSVGLWLDNVTNHTERLFAENVWLFHCKENLKFSVHGGKASFAYNTFLGLRINIAENQIAIRSENNAAIEGSNIWATINEDSSDSSAVSLSIEDASLWQNNTFHIQVDSARASTFLSLAPGATFKGFGILRPGRNQIAKVFGKFGIELQYGNVTIADGLRVLGKSGNNVMRYPTTRRWAYMTADGASATLDVVGDRLTATGTRFAVAPGSLVTQPPFVSYVTNSGGNANAGIHGIDAWGAAKAPHFETGTRLSSHREIRWWAGLTSAANVAMMTNSDNPAADYAAFYFCNDSGSGCSKDQTNYQCATKDGTTQNLIDSGVPADDLVHEFVIEFESAQSVIFRIDGARVCSSPVKSHLPRTNQSLRVVNGVQTMGAESRADHIAFIYVESD